MPLPQYCGVVSLLPLAIVAVNVVAARAVVAAHLVVVAVTVAVDNLLLLLRQLGDDCQGRQQRRMQQLRCPQRHQ